MDQQSERGFGQLLRRSRVRARLTQEELAQRSGYSTDYISKLERDQRRPPLTAVDRLAAVLELGEPEHQALLAARDEQRPGRAVAWPALPTPPTPLVGRIAEQKMVQDALAASRLVTLTGVGGAGKTRLALAVAHAAARDGAFAEGVAFVECATLRDSGLLASTLAHALGLVDRPNLSAEAQLIQVLHARHVLLVIDNLEQLLPEIDLLGRLVAAAPGLHVLATSRAPLRLYGEYEVRVPPLSIEDDAMDLFVARAREVAPGFLISEDGLSAIASICTALDGLPLAIELAAARVRLFPPEALLPRLGERLSVLASGPRDRPQRQQTLRATLDWSYMLLAEDERALFASLGVFAGSFSALAAASIGDSHGRPDESILAQLEALVDQSLLEVAPDDPPRFRMLETVRAYALQHLTDAGELGDMRQRHLRYYLELAEALAADLQGPTQVASLVQLEAEFDNLRAALDWVHAAGAVDEGLRLFVAVRRIWRRLGLLREGLDRVTAMLGLPDAASHPLCPQVLVLAGTLAWRLGDYDQAQRQLTEALALSRACKDLNGIGRALDALGNVAYRRGDYAEAALAYEEALAVRRQTGDAPGLSIALGNLGRLYFQQEDTQRAQALLEETLALKRQLGDTRGIAGTLTSLGRVAARRGDMAQATALLEESLALKHALGDRYGRITTLIQLGSVARADGNSALAAVRLQEALRIGQEIGASDRVAEALEALAVVAATDGGCELAARLGGAAEALRTKLGTRLTVDQQVSHDEMVHVALASLGTPAFEAAWAAGANEGAETTSMSSAERYTSALVSPAWGGRIVV